MHTHIIYKQVAHQKRIFTFKVNIQHFLSTKIIKYLQT